MQKKNLTSANADDMMLMLMLMPFPMQTVTMPADSVANESLCLC